MQFNIHTRYKSRFLIWRPSNAFESKPVVKIIYTYTHCNLWRHRQFITIFYQFLHIRIEIIHGSHRSILFLPRVGLYVSFLPFANARGKTSWYKGLPVVKTIYTYGFHELFLKSTEQKQAKYKRFMHLRKQKIKIFKKKKHEHIRCKRSSACTALAHVETENRNMFIA